MKGQSMVKRNCEASQRSPYKRLQMRRPLAFILILIAIAIVFPTPHTLMRTEARRDLVKHLDCSGTLKDGYSWHWGLTELPSYVTIIINIRSTEEVRVYIKSVEGIVYDKEGKVHDCLINYVRGPSLYVEIINPTMFGSGPSAVMSGGIEVCYDHVVQVPYTAWLPWWMP